MRSIYTGYIGYPGDELEKSLTKAAHYDNRRRITSLLDKDPSRVDEQDDEGRTVLYIAMQHGFLELVELLLNRGANTEIKTNQGKTTLQVAVSCNHVERVELLLKHDSSKLNVKRR